MSELAIHMISVEISRTRNEVRIPPLNVEPLAGKSGSKGGSQWNTCGGTTLVAKLVGKMHPMVWKWPKNGQYWTKNAIFGHKWPPETPGGW